MEQFKKILNDLGDKIINFFKESGWNILGGIFVLVVGYIVIKFIKMIIKKILYRSPIDNTLCTFILSILSAVLYMIYIFMVANAFHIDMTSFLALIASAGVAVGLALKDSLSNIANGIMIVSTKLFKEGDYVSINGTEGTVTAINMVTTVLVTPDNKVIAIPNNAVTSANIINYNGKRTRRLDLNISVSYDSDVDLVKNTLIEIANSFPLIMKDPQPFARLGNQGDSSLDFYFRVWVNSANYWDVYFDLQETIIKVFKEKGIEIPYNKLDINLIKEKKNEQEI